jgi:hypothetical protein
MICRLLVVERRAGNMERELNKEMQEGNTKNRREGGGRRRRRN